jgi:hypothetical protein
MACILDICKKYKKQKKQRNDDSNNDDDSIENGTISNSNDREQLSINDNNDSFTVVMG